LDRVAAWTPNPGRFGALEKPNPGIDGQITWKASSAPPPKRGGSASGAMILWNSRTEPGHPWMIMTGSASDLRPPRCPDRVLRILAMEPHLDHAKALLHQFGGLIGVPVRFEQPRGGGIDHDPVPLPMASHIAIPSAGAPLQGQWPRRLHPFSSLS
jgi:hypothetical protein